MTATERVLLIPKIENGFVIDHIPAGFGLEILRVVNQHHELDNVVITLGSNCKSRKLGRKDLLKFQTSQLPSRFLQHLSLICSGVTVKRIKNFEVEAKIVLEPPEIVEGFLACPNPNCITNHERGASTSFHLLNRSPNAFHCAYCERDFSMSELEAALPKR